MSTADLPALVLADVVTRRCAALVETVLAATGGVALVVALLAFVAWAMG